MIMQTMGGIAEHVIRALPVTGGQSFREAGVVNIILGSARPCVRPIG
jgi:hypothetical protein